MGGGGGAKGYVGFPSQIIGGGGAAPPPLFLRLCKLEDIAITTIILSPGCQQPFLIKMASDNRLSAASFDSNGW